ncbi:uracil-DNA glycosylase [Undibacterium sp. Di27W]|uniref:uracil-DNA glycosylase n=1 Tax=Undibacterium sp. Di27W TaxID=3413036 RepID=UPI003BF2E5BC
MSSWQDNCTEDVRLDIRLAIEQVHSSWRPVIEEGLQQVHIASPNYFSGLQASTYLPNQARLFAAFSMPMDAVRYVLMGEGPYPRTDSATGYCFMDGAVKSLWSDEEGGGLSKKVNRATSLRNFMKMLLVASGHLQQEATTGAAVADVVAKLRQADSGYIQSLEDLQDNLIAQGFLLLNASLVFRADTAPVKDAKAWQPFLQTVLSALYQYQQAAAMRAPVLVLWGKIAEQLRPMPEASVYEQICAEHPYNLSFIGNQTMQDFFRPMDLLKKLPEGKIL